MTGKILLIEDKESLRTMLRRALEENHFNVDEAKDGIEAIHRIKNNRYLLILSDRKSTRLNSSH